MKENEMFDIPDVVRYIAAYEKIPEDSGEFALAAKYSFIEPVSLYFLQRLFSVDPHDPDLGGRYLIDCCEIDKEQANALQPYLEKKLDLDSYDFMLECAKKD